MQIYEFYKGSGRIRTHTTSRFSAYPLSGRNLPDKTVFLSKEKNVFDRAEKTDFSEAEACAIDDTGKDYQEDVIRISYVKAYDAVKENIFLQIDFQADQAELYLNGEKISDQYFIGDVWEVSLKRFDFPTELLLRLYPLEEDDKIYLETQPDYVNGRCCSLKDIRCVEECKEKL